MESNEQIARIIAKQEIIIGGDSSLQECYDSALSMAKWKDKQMNDKLIALAMWMNERGFFKDDLQFDSEHQVMTFVELQNRKSEKGELDVCNVKNENRTKSNNPDEEKAKIIANDEYAEMLAYNIGHPLVCDNCGETIYDRDTTDVAFKSAMKMAEWKNEQFDKKLRGYFGAHIVPNGKYNLEFADDFIRFDKEKRKAVDEIIKQFNEFKE